MKHVILFIILLLGAVEPVNATNNWSDTDYYDTVSVSCTNLSTCTVSFQAESNFPVWATGINCSLNTTLTIKKIDFNLSKDAVTYAMTRNLSLSGVDNSNKVIYSSFMDMQALNIQNYIPYFKIYTTAVGSISGTCSLIGIKAPGGGSTYPR